VRALFYKVGDLFTPIAPFWVKHVVHTETLWVVGCTHLTLFVHSSPPTTITFGTWLSIKLDGLAYIKAIRMSWRRARSCATYSLLSEVPATLGGASPLSSRSPVHRTVALKPIGCCPNLRARVMLLHFPLHDRDVKFFLLARLAGYTLSILISRVYTR